MNDKIKLVSGGLVNVREAEKIAGVKKSKLYQLMEKGEIPYCKIGAARRIPKKALIEFLARNLIVR